MTTYSKYFKLGTAVQKIEYDPNSSYSSSQRSYSGEADKDAYLNYNAGRLTGSGYTEIDENEYKARQAYASQTPNYRGLFSPDQKTLGAMDNWVKDYMTQNNTANSYNSNLNYVSKEDRQAMSEQNLVDAEKRYADMYGSDETGTSAPKWGDILTLPSGQKIDPRDTNYDTYANQLGVKKPMANQSQAAPPTDIDPVVLAKPGIANLISSGREFSEIDAKNFAYANGDKNWQQYIGGIGGQPNPLYIGETNWQRLQDQKTYSRYQLEKATIRTANGIYWNPDVNIVDLPREDPNDAINQEANDLANIINDAYDEADKTYRGDKDKPDLTGDREDNENDIMALLNNEYGNDAESIYKELFNTPEMNNAKEKVNELTEKLDEYDEQMEELKNDIRKEVEGEAPDSYITALAVVRGEKIMKLKRQTQRDYDTALAQYNGLKEQANNLLQVRVKDADNRYNRLFSMLQLQIQQEGTAFNQEVALANIAMQIPEGRAMTISGITVRGLKENDDLNVVQFTEANGDTYVIGIDKKTGEQKYKEYIGRQRVPSSGGSGSGEDEGIMDFQEALYWLTLSKREDGSHDITIVPSDKRQSFVRSLAQNQGEIPKTEKTWRERQKEDWTDGSLWNVINPFD